MYRNAGQFMDSADLANDNHRLEPGSSCCLLLIVFTVHFTMLVNPVLVVDPANKAPPFSMTMAGNMMFNDH